MTFKPAAGENRKCGPLATVIRVRYGSRWQQIRNIQWATQLALAIGETFGHKGVSRGPVPRCKLVARA